MLVIINYVFHNIYMLLEWTELLLSFHTVPIVKLPNFIWYTKHAFASFLISVSQISLYKIFVLK